MITGPHFRRRIEIVPKTGKVTVALEDDYHRMTVIITHDDLVATAIEADMIRVPWTTCPGAQAELALTFQQQPLEAFAAIGEKTRNCTHLHDMALLGAAHVADEVKTEFDMRVSDPIGETREAELYRNGERLLSWAFNGATISGEGMPAGLSLYALSAWIATLDRPTQEAARLLRWGSMIALGRALSLDEQSAAGKQQLGVCYTFQANRIANARRTGKIRDFSMRGEQPLAEL